jgi:hypothetical protein
MRDTRGQLLHEPLSTQPGPAWASTSRSLRAPGFGVGGRTPKTPTGGSSFEPADETLEATADPADGASAARQHISPAI